MAARHTQGGTHRPDNVGLLHTGQARVQNQRRTGLDMPSSSMPVTMAAQACCCCFASLLT